MRRRELNAAHRVGVTLAGEGFNGQTMTHASHAPVHLHAGALELEMAAGLGGSILAFRKGSEDLLRPTPSGPTDVLETACFPLVPYANRIRDGRFSFGGRTARLERNLAGQIHPLHGDGWRGAWRVEAVDASSAILSFDAKGSKWPWSYTARQTLQLTPSSLTVELNVTNADTAPGPFGIGFHPYFPRSSEARLTASVAGVWMVDEELLPTRWAPGAPLADWSHGAPIRGADLIDHCHTGWAGEARIDYGPGGSSLRLTASPQLRYLHIYAPPQEDFFCVEPVSHAPDALNAAEPETLGVRILRPGESRAGWMRLEVEA